jgi:hypothetical protein
MKDLAPEAAVAEQGVDVVISSEAPVAELLPAEDGTPGAQVGVERVGVLDEVIVAGVEADLGAGDSHG